ncbi:cytochrome oxidase c subunit VIb-domain-containing protein [Mycena maculata]|uniref:Cytochrome oxidase c subunit VIb-domain-containing protein n=1 Tax=Mycena maculata TaxID=230809 RepID=A0AAD7JKI3_9AGAR|nr:cytochrome oxidase c subunit VIb-domain-containing protein [Mycena maculata]
MGWWPFGSSGSAVLEDPNPPTRQERQKCWEARDAYFACLDGVGVVKAGTEGKACLVENRVYQQTCAQSWIIYFNERRKLGFEQKDMLAQVNAQNAAAKR